MISSHFDRLTDDLVRRHAPPKPETGFLGYATTAGYLLIDAADPRYVHARTEDGGYRRALITDGLSIDKDVAVIFRKRHGKTYAYPNVTQDAETGVAAARAQDAQFGLIDTLRLEPGIVGFVDGQWTLTLKPLLYINWRGELKQSLGSPLDITSAFAGLGAGEYAWVVAGTDERTNDSTYFVSAATGNAPDILQALTVQQPLFQYQMAVLVHDGQAVLAFTFETWKDLRPWGSTPTRRRDNRDATSDPTATDDIASGYDFGSLWRNTVDGGVFECRDGSEGAAVWTALSTGTGVGDMLKVDYDSNADNVVDAADYAASVPWSGIVGIPPSYAPSAHSASHQSGGSDALKLDDLAAPDDNTDLDATTARHGLLPKLTGNTAHFLRGDGVYTEPPDGGGGSVDTIVAGTGISVDSTDPANPIISTTGTPDAADVTYTPAVGSDPGSVADALDALRAVPPGSAVITVQDSTGTPSYTDITTLEFVGGVLTEPSTGVARYTPASGGSGSGGDYILLRDEKAQGTHGGAFTSGSWVTRTLNTKVIDTGSHASLATNQFTLAAGTYHIRAHSPAMRVEAHQTRLQNITTGITVTHGTPEYASNGNYTDNRSFIDYRFTIASPTTFEIQHRCGYTQSDSVGLGQGANLATEIYTVVELWREP